MPDYKDLFYCSQIAIANTVQQLETMAERLRRCMQECEEAVMKDDSKQDTEQEQ